MSNEKLFAITINIKGILPSKFIGEANSILVDNFRAEVIRSNDNLTLVAVWEEDANIAVTALLKELGSEFTYSEPRVLYKEENGKILEPIMKLIVTTAEEYVGDVVGNLNHRRGLLLEMNREEDEKISIICNIPLLALFGFYAELMKMSQGSGIVSVEFEKYQIVPNSGGPDPNEPMSMALRA